MGKKAKFDYGLKAAEPIKLHYVVSMDNEKQTEASFEAFIDLVINHKTRIEQLIIVTSGWLHRLYVKEENQAEKEAEKKDINWNAVNQRAIQKLKEAGIKCEIFDWKKFVFDKTEYQCALVQVKNLYENDDKFKHIVDELAQNHASKNGFQAAVAYALEDATASFIFDKLHLTYPGKNLNKAFIYVEKYFNLGIEYIPHGIHQVAEKNTHSSNNNAQAISFYPIATTAYGEDLFTSCYTTAALMHKYSVIGNKNKERLFSQFLVLLEECQTSVVDEGLMDEKHNSKACTFQ